MSAHDIDFFAKHSGLTPLHDQWIDGLCDCCDRTTQVANVATPVCRMCALVRQGYKKKGVSRPLRLSQDGAFAFVSASNSVIYSSLDLPLDVSRGSLGNKEEKKFSDLLRGCIMDPPAEPYMLVNFNSKPALYAHDFMVNRDPSTVLVSGRWFITRYNSGRIRALLTRYPDLAGDDWVKVINGRWGNTPELQQVWVSYIERFPGLVDETIPYDPAARDALWRCAA